MLRLPLRFPLRPLMLIMPRHLITQRARHRLVSFREVSLRGCHCAGGHASNRTTVDSSSGPNRPALSSNKQEMPEPANGVEPNKC